MRFVWGWASSGRARGRGAIFEGDLRSCEGFGFGSVKVLWFGGGRGEGEGKSSSTDPLPDLCYTEPSTLWDERSKAEGAGNQVTDIPGPPSEWNVVARNLQGGGGCRGLEAEAGETAWNLRISSHSCSGRPAPLVSKMYGEHGALISRSS